jgi:hypothetical protein
MIYFIQAGNKIKIGRGKVEDRLKIAKTWTPDQPRLLLAIHVSDEIFAEAQLHRHFRDYRSNNEWFEINFASAFRALLDLKLIPEASQPILELPIVPPMHPEFRRWYVEFDWRSVNRYRRAPDDLTEEHLIEVDENLEELWHEHHRKFCADLEEKGSVEQMIKDSQIPTHQEAAAFLKSMKAMLNESGDVKPQ